MPASHPALRRYAPAQRPLMALRYGLADHIPSVKPSQVARFNDAIDELGLAVARLPNQPLTQAQRRLLLTVLVELRRRVDTDREEIP